MVSEVDAMIDRGPPRTEAALLCNVIIHIHKLSNITHAS